MLNLEQKLKKLDLDFDRRYMSSNQKAKSA